MNVTCKDGTICIETDNYEEQCEVFTGPKCEYPCDAKNCEVSVELDTMCKEFICSPPMPPTPPGSDHNLALKIGLPLMFLFLIGFLVIFCILKKRRSGRQNGELLLFSSVFLRL